jgi:[protein-PII] uridylyltransferase
VALDESAFADLVLGFPQRYLETTPALEVLKHYALMNALGGKPVISSLARNGDGYRICVVARDRRFLFARIAGSLTYFGLNITSAEAFANANALVLDTFSCMDPAGRLREHDDRRAFQAFLENAVAGQADLATLLLARFPSFTTQLEALTLAFDDDAHPTATRLRLQARDRVGLLYLVSQVLSRAHCDIEMAYVATAGGQALDDFFVSVDGRKLVRDEREAVATALASERDSLDAA